jgi:CubicO group peptidase (beta-lactamase class C family)
MAVLFGRRTPGLVEYVRQGWVGLTPFEIEGRAYGGLVGSLDDLVGLGRAFLSPGGVLSADSIRAMTRAPSPGAAATHGLGFFLDGDGWVGHTGEAGGYRAELRIHPSRGIGIAALANSGTATTGEVVHHLKES